MYNSTFIASQTLQSHISNKLQKILTNHLYPSKLLTSCPTVSFNNKTLIFVSLRYLELKIDKPLTWNPQE